MHIAISMMLQASSSFGSLCTLSINLSPAQQLLQKNLSISYLKGIKMWRELYLGLQMRHDGTIYKWFP